MSNIIDERILQMKFDNAQFESGIKESMSSLNKFDRSINSTENTTGFSALTKSIEGVSSGLSAMSIAGITAISRLTNAAIDAGKRIVSALTIDPLKSGFAEYQEQLDSTMVIMSNTGDDLETVTAALDELNVYADKTVYSFSQMTTAIGKFAAAGVNLDDSVAAIKGLSNAAALVGANNNQLFSAYYNLAQSMQMGYLQTIDYNSLANSTIMNKNMRDLMVETAIEMGKFTKESELAKEATENFKDSLQKKWLTSDVMLAALEKYADETTSIGKTATAAATEVKSMKQLVDTVLETVGTGWADSFKIIVGDLNEAKKLFTAINDFITPFIDSMSNSRNELLKVWKQAGGRQAVIDALFNSMKNVANIVGAIKQGIRDLFPAISGLDLARLSENLKNITSRMKLSKEELNGLRNTVRILLIPVKALSIVLAGIGTVMWNVAKAVTNLARQFLIIMSSSKNFNQALGSLKERIKDIFGEEKYERLAIALNAIKTNFINTVNTIKSEWDKLKKSLAESKVIKETFGEFESLGAFLQNGILEGIVRFFELLAKITSKINLDGISNGLLVIFEGASRGAGLLGNGLNLLFGGLGKVIGGVTDLAEKTDILNYVFSGIVAKGLYGFVQGISGIGLGIFGAGKAVKEFAEDIESVGWVIKGFAFQEFASGIKELAISVAILAGSMLALSLIDSDKILQTFGMFMTIAGTVSALSAGLLILISVLTKSKTAIGGLLNSLKLKLVIDEISSAMLKFGISVALLAASVKLLSTMNAEEAITGIVYLGIALGALVLAAEYMSKNVTQMTKGTKALISMAIAVGILATAIKTLGKLTPGEAIQGLIVMAGALTVLVTAAEVLSNSTKKLSKGTGALILMAVAVRILVPAIRDLGTLNIEQIVLGLGAIAGALIILVTAARNITGTAVQLVAGAAAMLIMAGAINVLVSAIDSLGKMDLIELAQGLVGIAAVMALFVGVLQNMSATAPLMLAGAAAMLIMAGAIDVLAIGLTAIGKMPFTDFIQGIAGLGLALAGMVGALSILGGLGPIVLAGAAALLLGSVAMLALAAAIRVLTPALVELIAQPADDILATLAALSGGLLLLGTVTGILGVVSPLILLCSVSIGALAVSLYLLQPALASMEKVDLSALAVGLMEFGTGSVAAGLGGVALIAGAVGVAAFAIALLTLAAAVATLNGVLTGAQIISDMFNAGASLMSEFVSGLGSKVGDIAGKALDCISGFVNTITSGISSLWTAGVAAGAAFIEGFSSKGGVDSHSDSRITIQKAKDCINGVVHTVTAGLGDLFNSGEEAGSSWIDGLVNGLDSGEADVKQSYDSVLFTQAHANRIRLLQEGKSEGEAWEQGFSQALYNAGLVLTDQARAIVANLDEVSTQQFYELNKNNGAFFRQVQKESKETTTAVEEYSAAATSAFSGSGGSASKAAEKVEDAFETIKDSIASSINVFEEFSEVETLSSSKLLANMASQIRGTEQWSNSFSQLAEKGFSETIIKKMADMGVESRKYISGMLEMSDEAVAAYNKMFAYTEKIADSSIDKIKVALPKLTESVANETKKTEEEIGHTTKEVDKNAKQVEDNIEEVDASLDDFVVNLNAYGTDVVPIAVKATEKLDETTENANDSLEEILNTTAEVTELDGELSDALVAVIDENGELIDSLEAVEDEETNIIDITKDMVLAYIEATNKMDEAIAEWKTNLKDTISGSINLFSKFDFTAEKSAQDMVDAIQTQRNALVYYNDGITKLLEKGLNVDYISELVSKGVDGSFEMIAALLSADDGQIKAINDTYEQIMGLEDSTVDNLADKFKDAGYWTVEGYATGLTENQEQIKQAFDAISTYGLDNFLSFWGIHSPSSVMREDGRFIDLGLAEGIQMHTPTVNLAGNKMAQTLRDGIKQFLNKSTFVQYGADVCYGLIQGIREHTSEVEAAARSLAQAANEAFRLELDINSPSGVFEDSGMFIDLGLARGIEHNADDVTNSARQLGNSVIGTMSEAIRRASELATNDLDTDPVIRPVMDLSEIQNGRKELDSLLNKSVDTSVMKASVAASAYSESRRIATEGNSESTTSNGATYNFTQNNYSPKALDRIEIYRQTKNQFSAMKGLV